MSIIDLTPPPPPPRKGEILFREDRDLWPANAIVGQAPWRGDYDPPCADGYRMAARRLAEDVCADERRGSNGHYLVYPIVFLYRHYVELVLKQLLVMIADLAEEALDHKCSKDLEHHRLSRCDPPQRNGSHRAHQRRVRDNRVENEEADYGRDNARDRERSSHHR